MGSGLHDGVFGGCPGGLRLGVPWDWARRGMGGEAAVEPLREGVRGGLGGGALVAEAYFSQAKTFGGGGAGSREGEKDICWTAGTARGGTGPLGLTHTEPQRGRLRTACGQRRVDGKNSQTTPAATSTSSIRQLLGAADAQTAHQPLGSANAETTPARAPAAAADRTQRPDATCGGKSG